MKEFLKNKIVKYLLSSVLFGAIYSLLSFADKGYVETGTILRTTMLYFLIMCLLYFIAPKLRKITGHDKDNS